MQLDTGQWLVIGVCAILIAWYVGGYYYNRQRAEVIFAWLKAGLSACGSVSLGDPLTGMATGGRLNVSQAIAPFRSVEAIYVLAPRENLPFLIFHRLLGKRDELILKMNLRTAPDVEIEVSRSGNRQFRRLVSNPDKKTFEVKAGPRGFEIASRGKRNIQFEQNLQAILETYSHTITRISIQRKSPNLIIQAHLAALTAIPAEAFFASIQQLI